ncbi:MAG TPA: glycosyltransferase [Chthoniobacterales bacterium]|jgi:spore maturation protein CgeB|nr:glycosyltransferase [Chthoniobacterales bacterium]
MNIAFFPSSLLSAYWNGAATYYRGLIKALHNRGHRITVYEPDAYERQQHRDLEPPSWARVVVYENSEEAALRALERAGAADMIVKASGIGVFDELLESAVLEYKRPNNYVVFCDVDAPATLERVANNSEDPFRECIPRYDFIFTYGGGPPVVHGYESLGAQLCVPIYNGLDPETHHPVRPDTRFQADLGFLGHRLPDREARVEEFFLRAAEQLQARQFLLGGIGWDSRPLPANVKNLGHVYTAEHNAFNCTPRMVLNISRASMARYGYSPATRVFEAAGAGACLVTDAWQGVETFFAPNEQILVANNGNEVAAHVVDLTPERARQIGAAAYHRALAEHTYAHRAAQFDEILEGAFV